MAASPEYVLLGDIGATNARFALLGNGAVGAVDSIAVADHPRFTDAIEAFIRSRGAGATIAGAVLAVAGPVEAGRCVLTNCPWLIDAAELRGTFGFATVRVLNDFEATALALPHLTSADLHPLGGGSAVADAPMAVLGPGTGLGVACFIPGSQASVIATEGGHATLPATCAREDAIVDYLRRQFGHVSAERAISGSGLENLYRAVAAIDGIGVPERNAAEITQCALDGSCATSRAALDLFCAMLGTVAGNVALNFGARGGVYIAGGIAPRIVRHLAGSEFRARFEAKGRFQNYLKTIPTSVIVHPNATFMGLKALAKQARSAQT